MSFRGGGGGRRQTCRFFLEGRCKFGDNCNYEHPSSQSSNQQSYNRFGALSNNGGGGGGNAVSRGGDRYRPGDNRNAPPYGLSRDSIRADVTTGGNDGERPLWPMSCYAPGRDAPRQLIEGPDYEISPEEVRLLFYLAQASGDPNQMRQYEQNESAAAAKAEEAAREIRNDPDKYIQLIVDARDQHPNRIDQSINPSGAWQRPAVSSSTSTGSFGAPSQPSTFGRPTTNQSPFGMQQQPQTGFGAPSPMGQQSSGFGAPSTLGVGRSSAFGAPSALGSGGAAGSSPFGGQTQQQQAQPSGFGAPSGLGQRPSPFAQQQPQQAPSGFGQASAQGAATSTLSPFAANQQPSSNGFSSPSPFAQPAKDPAPAFGTSSFGQPAGLGNAMKPAFGQASSTGASPFASASATSNPSPFAQTGGPSGTTAFGQSAPSSNPFGQANGNVKSSSPFAQPQPQSQQNSQQPTTGFGAPSQSLQQQPQQPQQPQAAPLPAAATGAPVASYTTRNPNGSLQTWKGQQVTYVRLEGDDSGPPVPTIYNARVGQKERIWLPDGPPPVPNPGAEGPPSAYEGEIGEALKRAYDFAQQNGLFQNDIMPEVPPRREWIRWDL